MKRPPTGLINGLVVIGEFCLLLWLEHRRPLRRRVEPKLRRSARNLSVAALSGVVLHATERPFIAALISVVENRRWGLLKQCSMPRWLEAPLAVALMDYTLYFWHVLMHRSPWLWRLHLPHHADLDLDASTALRFHFSELVVSTAWRAGQVALIGISPPAYFAWQRLLMLSILFHHSNVELPIELERWLSRVIVTPRLHGIHHSIVREETDSNWSSGLTLWDWVHGTLKLNVPQQAISIGVPAYRQSEQLSLPKIIAMPFASQPPSWQLPANGQPRREALPGPNTLLAQ
ncbi:MAG TPA: sterol desaturase family protein [Candidatus Polarisedimenticolaceae bacterium]|nr:sterol desaturase family protein [Candidatus Polarisedimenticolaceae bacterium]